MKRKDWMEEYFQMIEDCENRESRLNDWETNFIDSIRNTLESIGALTIKQTETLENIWEKVTKKG